MKILLVLVAIVVASPSSHAAWWFSDSVANDKMGITNNPRRLLMDDPVEVKIGDITCGAKKTGFWRISDRNVTEFRQLYCRTDVDTVVSTTVNCDYPHYSMESLSVYKGANLYTVTLTCGPKN